MSSLRRTVAAVTVVAFMAVWGAVVALGPGGTTSSASVSATPASTGTSSKATGSASSQGTSSGDTASQSTPSNDTAIQASAPLTTSQS